MDAGITSWARDGYVDDGGDPCLFYVVFGKIDWSAPFSRLKYRSEGNPAGLKISGYGPDQHPEVLDRFRQGYVWDTLVASNPELAQTIRSCQHCVVLQGTPEEPTNLDYLRDTIGLITFMLDQGGIAVYDPFVLRWWSSREWREEVFAPSSAEPRKHTVILVSEEVDPALHWFHTRGMQKFGRPDISIHDVPKQFEEGVIDLCNRLIEYQAAGHVIAEGQPVRMASLPEGGVMRHQGDVEDPDFNNVHLEVRWPDGLR